MRRVVTAILWLAAAGCASGFDRGVLQQELRAPREVRETSGEATIAEALARRPQLAFPARIGVYFVPPEAPRHERNAPWRWTERDKRSLLAAGAELRTSGVVADFFPVSDLVTPGADFRSVRLAAARQGADAVLFVRGASQVDRYVNPLSLLNVTLVGMWVFPGHHRDALFIMQSALLDVGNEYVYATVDAEGTGKTTRPFALAGDEGAIAEAKRVAIEDFAPELVRRLKGLRGS